MKDNLTLSLFDAATSETPAELIPPVIVTTPEENTWQPITEDSEWGLFVQAYGRVPLITDERKPWTYRGWLMHYVLLIEEQQDIPKRWNYWFNTMMSGKLLEEQIPRISLSSRGDGSRGYKEFSKWVDIVDRNGRGWSSMGDLLDWLMFGLGLSKERPKFDDDLDEKLYRAVNIGPMMLEPCDYIGQWIADHKGNWNPLGFYPTPHEVCEMMVQMNFPEGEDYRSKTVCDPALGTGRLLLHASNHSLRLYGNDIDHTVLKACKINGALYAPWMVRPFPEEFFQ
jgi:hypothetical protein